MRRAALALVLVAGLLQVAPRAQGAATTAAGPKCGALDLPETGVQGSVPRVDQVTGRAKQGYNCGVSLVGHVRLSDTSENANMAWASHCAYVASAHGVAVVDVSDPRHPRQTETLHGTGVNFSLETITASTAGGRAVLIAGRYGPAPFPVPAPVAIFDVTNCAHPVLKSTFTFPENIHNLTITPDGKRLYATQPIQVLDIQDLAHPKFLGKIEDQIPQPGIFGTFAKYLAHEAWFSPDGHLLYLGGQTPMFDWFTIVDVTNWPARPVKVLSQVKGRGHSIRTMTIKGRTYALHSEESIVDPLAKGCAPESLNPFAGVAEPWISDVTDPAHPKLEISQFHLAINDAANCATQMADGVNASVHYHDVDDPKRTTFAMASMWNAGLRIIDVRNPLHPKEAGYFNPGMWLGMGMSPVLDQAWGHVRYVASSGHIWFATATGGFWVVELEPQVRKALGLPARHTDHPKGGAPRPFDTQSETVAPSADASRWYCTLAPGRAVVTAVS